MSLQLVPPKSHFVAMRRAMESEPSRAFPCMPSWASPARQRLLRVLAERRAERAREFGRAGERQRHRMPAVALDAHLQVVIPLAALVRGAVRVREACQAQSSTPFASASTAACCDADVEARDSIVMTPSSLSLRSNER